jgi:hypothetical protein
MAAEWFYTTNKQQMGPVSWDELQQLASSGLLKPSDLVWSEGMAEWVKAVRQNGLFPDSAAPTAVTAEADEADEAPPPPPKRSATRKRIDEELDEHDEGERRQRRKAKKGSGAGLKIGLIIGVVVLVLIVMGCGLIGVLAIIFGGSLFGGGVGGGDYTTNLAPNTHHDRTFTFTRGQRVTITVTSDRNAGPFQPDVDLFVLHRGNIIASDVRISPDCFVNFVAPANDSYTVRVNNLGPGFARSRVSVR